MEPVDVSIDLEEPECKLRQQVEYAHVERPILPELPDGERWYETPRSEETQVGDIVFVEYDVGDWRDTMTIDGIQTQTVVLRSADLGQTCRKLQAFHL